MYTTDVAITIGVAQNNCQTRVLTSNTRKSCPSNFLVHKKSSQWMKNNELLVRPLVGSGKFHDSEGQLVQH